MTDNVVFVSVQRVLVLKRTAALRSRSRAKASRDDCLFLLQVILAMFRPGSRSFWVRKTQTVASDKMQVEKETVISYRFTVLRQEHGPVLGRAVLYS